MIKLDENQLAELSEFATLMFSDAELAEILEVTTAELKAEMKITESPVRRTILAARYKVEASIRKAQIDMALRGSTPALAACLDLIKKMKT